MIMIKRIVLVFCLMLCTLPAWAQFRVDVVGVGQTQYPITIAPFKGASSAPQNPGKIITDDLMRSGYFRSVPMSFSVIPDENTTPDFKSLLSSNINNIVMGSVIQLADGRYDVRARLWDAVHSKDMGGQSYVISASDLRIVAHKIADFIYKSITGQRGVFSTRIAYITKDNKDYNLWIADSDGESAQSALKSKESIISPAWSPLGNQLAYVSFESLKPVVYIQNLITGKRRLIADFKGSNSAPAWSPDGKSLAVTLSRDGGSQIFLINVQTGKSTRLIKSTAIDTEPYFSPDGTSLFFVSDRGGSPQIYRMTLSDQKVTRITFDGDYNTSPAISPDGTNMAYISRKKNSYQLAIMDLATGISTIITDTADDNHPRFAPNGKLLIYSTISNGREVLMTSTLDGSIKASLISKDGEIREPAWGPFSN
jgi:TolB protein